MAVDPNQPDQDDASPWQTDWSAIHIALRGDPLTAEEAWSRLAARYCPAIHAFIQRLGHTEDAARDLTQSFVCDVVIGRRLFERADRRRGRFRNLLLTALRRFLTERHRAATRMKRLPPGGRTVPLDAVAPARDPAGAPDVAFARRWADILIRSALESVAAECECNGLGVHWSIFDARVVRPLLLGERPVPYETLVLRHGLRTAAQAAGMMIVVKRRFAAALRDGARETVSDDSETEGELRELAALLEGCR